MKFTSNVSFGLSRIKLFQIRQFWSYSGQFDMSGFRKGRGRHWKWFHENWLTGLKVNPKKLVWVVPQKSNPTVKLVELAKWSDFEVLT